MKRTSLIFIVTGALMWIIGYILKDTYNQNIFYLGAFGLIFVFLGMYLKSNTQ